MSGYIENYDSVYADMVDFGLLVGNTLQLNTIKPVRVKTTKDSEQRGSYHLSRIYIVDKTYISGFYGIWTGNTFDKVKVTPKLKKDEVTPEQRRAWAERMKADIAAAEQAEKAARERGAMRSNRYWQQLRDTGQCQYLVDKGVQAYGLRFHPTKDTAYMPYVDIAGRIWGLQIMRGRDREPNKPVKQNLKGGTKQGKFHLIGYVRDLVIIVEGYATGATIYEATGIPVIIAADAGNLWAVASEWRKQRPALKILFAADDDYHHVTSNPGIAAAQSAATAVKGEYLAPVFATRPHPQTDKAKQYTDFNDLARVEGIAAVRAQIENYLLGIGWLTPRTPLAQVPAVSERVAMKPRLTIDEAAQRFIGTFGFGGKVVFDTVTRRLIVREDVMNLLPDYNWKDLLNHPDWQVIYDDELGFDPGNDDPKIKCNLYGGWPTVPKAGSCQLLLDLLLYECSGESNYQEVYNWILDWVAYPIQYPGAKMHSAIVMHGKQGTGKSLFFECIVKIYGEYGRVLGQESLEDKFNSDWAEKRLFILAEEILARQDMFHVKNRLKGFITGSTIRVNPKNVAAHNEANHMNIVFLSNERMPLVLENDDRRHLVVWTPEKLDATFYNEVIAERDNGGIAALHHYLLQRDLSHFKPSSRPPMTAAKQDLIQQSASNEEIFITEWEHCELTTDTGTPIPFCPCLGSDLYRVYQRWCQRNGEKPRRAQDLIGMLNKRAGWSAGKPVYTWAHAESHEKKQRKMVVPSATSLAASVAHNPQQYAYCLEQHDSTITWLTMGYVDFARVVDSMFTTTS